MQIVNLGTLICIFSAEFFFCLNGFGPRYVGLVTLFCLRANIFGRFVCFNIGALRVSKLYSSNSLISFVLCPTGVQSSIFGLCAARFMLLNACVTQLIVFIDVFSRVFP